MKTDLKTIKKELKRLADVDVLKKEINRLAAEIKKFDVHTVLTPAAGKRLDELEKRFRDLLKTLAAAEKQVEARLEKFMKLVRRSTTQARSGAKKTVRKAKAKKAKTSRKTSSTKK